MYYLLQHSRGGYSDSAVGGGAQGTGRVFHFFLHPKKKIARYMTERERSISNSFHLENINDQLIFHK